MASLLEMTTVQPRESAPGGRRPAAVALSVVQHPDARRVGELAPLFDLGSRRSQPLGRLEPVFRRPSGERSDSLATPLISRSPLIFRGLEGAAVSISAPPKGSALSLDGEPVSGETQVSDAQVRAGVVLELSRSVALLLHVVELGEPQGDLGMLGHSAAMHDVRQQIVRVAELAVPVLLRGESGVGKELAAAAIHRESGRRQRRLVAVNMAALPESTAAAELFGHARGAFTGADGARAGYFEQADGGTLFLDEVGELPEALQPMLLRALESGELQRVGGGGRRVDVRVVSATDADLEAAVAAGRFREPLLQRLSAYEIRIPPLRERRQDIAPLFLHFLRQELEASGEVAKLDAAGPEHKGFLRADFMARLVRHDLPGNGRQLRNIARRAAIASRGERRLVVDDGLERVLCRSERPPAAVSAPAASSARPPGEIDDAALLQALREHAFNLNRTAAALGMSRTWLNTRIERCALIRKAKDLDAVAIRAAAEAHGGDLQAMAASLEVSPRGLQLQMKRLGLR